MAEKTNKQATATAIHLQELASFTPFYVQMARQGEADGVLGGALVSLADYLDQEIRQGPGGSGASGVAATGLVAALLGTTGAAIMGAAGFLAAGHILQWGALGGP